MSIHVKHKEFSLKVAEENLMIETRNSGIPLCIRAQVLRFEERELVCCWIIFTNVGSVKIFSVWMPHLTAKKEELIFKAPTRMTKAGRRDITLRLKSFKAA